MSAQLRLDCPVGMSLCVCACLCKETGHILLCMLIWCLLTRHSVSCEGWFVHETHSWTDVMPRAKTSSAAGTVHTASSPTDISHGDLASTNKSLSPSTIVLCIWDIFIKEH